jgi:hypothetical protein
LVVAMVGPQEQINFKLGWSVFRRAHQAIARRCHKASHRMKRAAGRRGDGRREPDSEPTETTPPPPPATLTAAHGKDAGSLTEAEWKRVSELLPEQKPGWGRPRRDDRQVLRAILWVLDTGATWRELPEGEFGPNSTARGRYRKWLEEGLWSRIVQALGR